MNEEELTGNKRFRVNWNGKLILQVEVKPSSISDTPNCFRRWRDAKVEDISLDIIK